MEEYKGRKRKQQQISVLYWFFRRNSLPSSSPRSFRTQSYGFLHYKTMSWFRATSSNTLIMSEVQSVFFSIINSGLIPKLGHNWWRANGIRVECFPRIHHIATLLQCPRVPVKNERRTRRVHKKDHLHVDVQRHLMGIWRQYKRMRIKCSTRFSKCKKIWSRTMVIPRTWIREKWYSTSEDSPQGERDRIAEQMLLTLGERTHPVFRSTSPLSRGVLKCKGGGKLSIHCCADLETIKTVFRTIIWSSSCRCSTTSQGHLKTMNRNAN